MSLVLGHDGLILIVMAEAAHVVLCTRVLGVEAVHLFEEGEAVVWTLRQGLVLVLVV